MVRISTADDFSDEQVGSGGRVNPVVVEQLLRRMSGSVHDDSTIAGPVLLVPIGTGGHWSSDHLDCLGVIQSTGFCGLIITAYGRTRTPVADTRGKLVSAKEALAAIRRNLGLSISDTAQVLRVQRPTIYEWLSSGSPRPNNAKRLHEIYEIASAWSSMSQETPRRYVHNPVLDGKSLIDLLTEEPLDRSTISEAMKALGDQLSADREARRNIAQIAKEHGFEAPSQADQSATLRRISSAVSDADD